MRLKNWDVVLAVVRGHFIVIRIVDCFVNEAIEEFQNLVVEDVKGSIKSAIKCILSLLESRAQAVTFP